MRSHQCQSLNVYDQLSIIATAAIAAVDMSMSICMQRNSRQKGNCIIIENGKIKEHSYLHRWVH